MDQLRAAKELTNLPGIKNYTTEYEWVFPYIPTSLPDGRITWRYEVRLITPRLEGEEREQLLARFRQRLERLEQVLQELEGYEVTDQLVWRCLALITVQVQQAFWSLEQTGFHLLANGMDVRRDLVWLHALLEKWWKMPSLPSMDVYYQLPAYIARLDDGSLDMALSINGQAQCIVNGWTYQVNWDLFAQHGVLTIIPPLEQSSVSNSVAVSPIIKQLASEEERARALYEPGEEYPPVSRQQGWLPCLER